MMKGSLQGPLKLRPYCAMDFRRLPLLGVDIDIQYWSLK